MSDLLIPLRSTTLPKQLLLSVFLLCERWALKLLPGLQLILFWLTVMSNDQKTISILDLLPICKCKPGLPATIPPYSSTIGKVPSLGSSRSSENAPMLEARTPAVRFVFRVIKNAAVFTRPATAGNFCHHTCWQGQNSERDDQESDFHLERVTSEYCSPVVESKTEIFNFCEDGTQAPKNLFFFLRNYGGLDEKEFRDFYRFFLGQLQNSFDYFQRGNLPLIFGRELIYVSISRKEEAPPWTIPIKRIPYSAGIKWTRLRIDAILV